MSTGMDNLFRATGFIPPQARGADATNQRLGFTPPATGIDAISGGAFNPFKVGPVTALTQASGYNLERPSMEGEASVPVFGGYGRAREIGIG